MKNNQRNIYIILVLVFFITKGYAQPLPFNKTTVDSIILLLPNMKDDTNKVNNLILLSQMYIAKGDSMKIMQYAHEADSLAQKFNSTKGRIGALFQMAFYHATTGSWPQSVLEVNQIIPLLEKYSKKDLIGVYNIMFINAATRNDLKEARLWALKALHHQDFENGSIFGKWPTYMQLGLSYEWENRLDSAQFYADILKEYLKKYHHPDLEGNTYILLGNIARKRKNYEEALFYYRQGDQSAIGLAWTYDEMNKADSAIYYAHLALKNAQERYNPRIIIESTQLLARRYAKTNPALSNQYLNLYINTKDTLFNTSKLKQLEDIRLNEQQLRNDQIGREKGFRSRMIQYGLMGLAALFLISALLFYRNNKIKKAANEQLEKANTDLKNTQTQLELKNRDLEIEAALDKIRSTSLAMHQSSEIQNVVGVLFEKLKELGLIFDGGAAIHLFTEGVKDAEIWVASQGETAITNKVNLPFDAEEFKNNPIILDVWNAHNTGTHIYNKGYSLDEKNKYFNYVFKHNNYDRIPDIARKFILAAESYTASFVSEKHSMLGANSWSGQLFSEVDFDLLKRVARVFEQAYVRFLDLQKAEEQNREAQIEVALERVRSKTMVMQHSNQLREITATTLEQLQRLGFTYGACSIVIMDAVTGDMIWWISGFDNDYPESYHIPYFDHPFYLEQLNYWKEGKKYAVMVCEGEAKKAYDKYIFSQTEFVKIPAELQKIMQAFEKITFSNAYMQHGALSWSTEPLSDEYAKILQRFASVFEQSYTRFLDLQKAEAQAREAQIEAALEKVRSRTMAMQKSEELREVILLLLKTLPDLGISMKNRATGIFTYEEGNKDYYQWAASPEYNSIISFHTPYIDHPVQNDIWNARRNGTDFYAKSYTVQEKNSLFKFFFELPALKNMPLKDKKRALGFKYYDIAIAFEQNSAIVVVSHSGIPLTEDENEILKRFSKVFEQTYTRFLDLQKAEAQTREAQIEAALERVRSRSMAMHKSEELADLSLELVKQVQALGVSTWFCAFNINDEDGNGSMEWGSNGIGTFPKYRTPREGVFLRYYKAGKKGETLFVNVIGEEECPAHYEYLCSLPGVGEQLLGMKAAGIPFPVSQIDHVAFFKYGYIIFITYEPVPESHEIFKRFAKVFEQTYTRFLDLKKAEAQAFRAEQDLVAIKEARKKAEEALSELQQTQKQLIQSEKMASLGELTAGIAHEIQNPLNFVNNFSEVSKELLDEMREAIKKGDAEEAKEIMNDVIQNLEKINHHGRRADGIVKGMLQHSRSSSGTKEPTDINALADEYLRLAYHGLRAKDKAFNATMKTEYEEGLEKVNVIPQDIGRVVLNLITNAFYTVNEKKKSGIEGYEPTVTISTKKTDDKVELTVKDNGSGIPQKVLDKIFQPFFTTKPTGQGTGLGLSLAFDIVKSHGGELIVETNEGEGSEFIILLPG